MGYWVLPVSACCIACRSVWFHGNLIIFGFGIFTTFSSALSILCTFTLRKSWSMLSVCAKFGNICSGVKHDVIVIWSAKNGTGSFPRRSTSYGHQSISSNKIEYGIWWFAKLYKNGPWRSDKLVYLRATHVVDAVREDGQKSNGHDKTQFLHRFTPPGRCECGPKR